MAITINNVRLSYCNLFQPKPPKDNPNGEKKFGCVVLVPKTDTAAKAAIDAAIAQATDAGVSKVWGGIRPPQPNICVHDGDGPRPSDGMPYGEECKSMWVFAASAKADKPPFVVDGQVQKIIDPTQVYSGMWANVNVNFYAYNFSGKKGIGCGLNGVQKLRDDTPLSGQVTAEEAFSAIPGSAPAAPTAGWGAPTVQGWGAPAEPAAAAGTAWGVPTHPGVAPWG